MTKHILHLPDGFDDLLTEAKGWFPDARLESEGRIYRLTFYDPVRLAQEIESDLERGGFFLERNLVIVPRVERKCLNIAVKQLIEAGGLAALKAEPSPDDHGMEP